MVVLVDTSIWIDHFASSSPGVRLLIAERKLAQHPFVTGEIAVGNLPNQLSTIRALRGLPQVEPVSDDEFHGFLVGADLVGTGVGFVDVHLLAAAASLSGATIWTRDRRMREQSERLGVAYNPA